MLKSQVFTTPGAFTFNVPSNVSGVLVNMIAGSCGSIGGAGSGGYGGSGSGEKAFGLPVPVTPGGTVAGVIGAAGTVGNWTTPTYPGAGGDTIFGALRVKGSRATGGILPAVRYDNTQANLFAQRGFYGGGATGGYSTAANDTSSNPTADQGTIGQPASIHFFGGVSGGGGKSASALVSSYGGPSGGINPGSGFVTADRTSGGGASSPWGLGASGAGRDTNGNTTANYGAGPSGGGGQFSAPPTSGVAGMSGRVEVFWFES